MTDTCPVCKSADVLLRLKLSVSGKEFRIVQCSRCTIASTLPVLSPGELNEHYHAYYGRRKSFADGIINGIRSKRVGSLHVSGKPPRILDVGCGNGLLIEKLQKQGWSVKGTEIAPADHIKGVLSDRICQADLVDCRYETKEFDVVMMWHVLEHVSDLRRYIEEVERVLKVGGYFVIEVPNFDSWQAKLFKKSWFHLDVPRHVFHFTPSSLQSLLEQKGFSVKSVSHVSDPFYNVFGILQSGFNLFSARNSLFGILNGKFLDASGKRFPFTDYLLIIVFVIPAALLSLLFYFLEIVFRRSGVITVYAQKK